jgi:hypothetical protein
MLRIPPSRTALPRFPARRPVFPARRPVLIVVSHEAANYAPVGSEKKLGDNLVDIHKQRLELMDKYGVEMQVLSLTSPGPQGT